MATLGKESQHLRFFVGLRAPASGRKQTVNLCFLVWRERISWLILFFLFYVTFILSSSYTFPNTALSVYIWLTLQRFPQVVFELHRISKKGRIVNKKQCHIRALNCQALSTRSLNKSFQKQRHIRALNCQILSPRSVKKIISMIFFPLMHNFQH